MEGGEFAVEMEEEVKEDLEDELEDANWGHMKIMHHQQMITQTEETEEEWDGIDSSNTVR